MASMTDFDPELLHRARILSGLIADVLDAPADEKNLARVRGAVGELCAAFPVYG